MFRSTPTNDDQLFGAEIMFGKSLLGHVEALGHDPHSHRVRRLITSCGMTGRRVGVPLERVIKRYPSRVVLGVGIRSLNDLADWASPERPIPNVINGSSILTVGNRLMQKEGLVWL